MSAEAALGVLVHMELDAMEESGTDELGNMVKYGGRAGIPPADGCSMEEKDMVVKMAKWVLQMDAAQRAWVVSAPYKDLRNWMQRKHEMEFLEAPRASAPNASTTVASASAPDASTMTVALEELAHDTAVNEGRPQ